MTTKIEDKIWITSKARIQAEKRLISTSFHSRMILLWYSFCAAGVAIYNLSADDVGEVQEAVLVIYSVLILAASSFVQGSRLGERAENMKQCYVKLQYLLRNVELKNIDKATASVEYTEVLQSYENHKLSDYYAARCIAYLTSKEKSKVSSDVAPTLYIFLCFLANQMVSRALIALLYAMPVIFLWLNFA